MNLTNLDDVIDELEEQQDQLINLLSNYYGPGKDEDIDTGIYFTNRVIRALKGILLPD